MNQFFRVILCGLSVLFGGAANAFPQHVPVSTTVRGHESHALFQPRPAPAWALPDFAADVVSSRQLDGQPQVVILFLGNGCPHCVEQLERFSPRVADFQEAGFQFVAISSDGQEQLAASIDQFDGVLPYRILLADPKLDVFRKFGAFDRDAGAPLHGTFLIDGNGMVRWQHVGHQPFMDHEFLYQRALRLVNREARPINAAARQDQEVQRPKVFLDKSPRIVAYQLKRLDNARLLLVERDTTDKKYLPVYSAILSRAGMSRQYRDEALAAMVKLNGSDPVDELVSAIEAIQISNRQTRQTSTELSRMLLGLPSDILTEQTAALVKGRDSANEVLRAACFAGLTIAGRSELSWQYAVDNGTALQDWLAAVPFIRDTEIKSSLRDKIIGLIESDQPTDIRNAAIQVVTEIGGEQASVFRTLAGFVSNQELRDAAVSAMIKIPNQFRESAASRRLVDRLVELAEKTPAEQRTEDNFSEAMQLADQLLTRLPVDEAKSFRRRLREVSVRVVRILTVEDEMRYDLPYFAVEAGRPVQIVLKNEDLAAHNLVVTQPGELKTVASLGLATGPRNGMDGKAYVPESDKVLFATHLVPAYKQEKLTFNAPSQPGEYPYVCTFPQHWPRMYGVMVVVEDLDAWLKNPVAPKDPIGSTRAFVQKWTTDDLVDDLDTGLRGRSAEIGKRIFAEATCIQCHKLGQEGGAVGPDLNTVVKKWKGDRRAILREILEPSHQIDEQYSMHMILTLDGETITGIIQEQDDTNISVIDNPESKQPRKILVDDVDEMVKTTKSIMPKALLDRFTRDEILELLAYIESLQDGERAR